MAGKVLAEEVDADILLILTNVDSAKLDYGKPTERLVKEMTASQARTYIAEGQFPPGNMGPKVEACIKFVESVGEKAIITSLERAVEALKGRAGTLMTRG